MLIVSCAKSKVRMAIRKDAANKQVGCNNRFPNLHCCRIHVIVGDYIENYDERKDRVKEMVSKRSQAVSPPTQLPK